MEIFENRAAASQQLVPLLQDCQHKPDTLVLALPRGGVAVAFAVAHAVQLPLDVFLVRKLGAPGNAELALSAIAENDVIVFNAQLIQQLTIKKSYIEKIIMQEKAELRRRKLRYHTLRDVSKILNQHIILIDDGIATGATVKVALEALWQLDPLTITLAIPVAAATTLQALKALTNEIICIATPTPFYGVGRWYRDFTQVSDEEVCQLLTKAPQISQL